MRYYKGVTFRQKYGVSGDANNDLIVFFSQISVHINIFTNNNPIILSLVPSYTGILK